MDLKYYGLDKKSKKKDINTNFKLIISTSI